MIFLTLCYTKSKRRLVYGWNAAVRWAACARGTDKSFLFVFHVLARQDMIVVFVSIDVGEYRNRNRLYSLSFAEHSPPTQIKHAMQSNNTLANQAFRISFPLHTQNPWTSAKIVRPFHKHSIPRGARQQASRVVAPSKDANGRKKGGIQRRRSFRRYWVTSWDSCAPAKSHFYWHRHVGLSSFRPFLLRCA